MEIECDLLLTRKVFAIIVMSILEKGEPGKGARFEMTVPMGAYRFSDKQ